MNIIKKIAPENCLRIGFYFKKTNCLGPYERFALWLQGCERGCKDCIATDMQSLDGGNVYKIDDIATLICKDNTTEGITISGGEPFYQADKLCILLENVRNIRKDFGCIIYTGYRYEELLDSGEPYIAKLLKMTDILIDGEYLSEYDDNLGLRGSSNQRIRFLSDRYKECADIYTENQGRKNRIIISDKKFQMIGIPSIETKKILKDYSK